MANTPPGVSKLPPNPINDFDEIENPFKSKKSLANSPQRDSSLPPVQDFSDVDPFKSRSQIAVSPPASPTPLSNNNNNKSLSDPVDSNAADLESKENSNKEIVPKYDYVFSFNFKYKIIIEIVKQVSLITKLLLILSGGYKKT